MRLSFRAKLVAIVGTAALALVVLIAAGILSSSRTERELSNIEKRYLPRLELGPRLDGQFERLKRGLQDAVAARDADALNATRETKDNLLSQLNAAGAIVTPGQVAALRIAIDDYYVAALDVSRRLLASETGEKLVEAMGAMQAKQARAADLLVTVTAVNRSELTSAFQSARQAEISGRDIRLGISLICLTAVILLSSWIGRGVIRSVGELSVGLRRFGGGDFSRPIPVVIRDEIGDLADQANQMAGSLKRLGDERDRSDWVKGALAGLAQELRGELEPAEVAGRAIRFLARYLEAPLAALYYVTRGDQELCLLAHYAGSAAAGGPEPTPSFRLGEGLVGQAALTEEITVVSNPPADYVRIRSGLGEGGARAIVLLPLSHVGRVRGIVELALFAPWSDRAREAMEGVRETLTIAIEVARARAATRELLAETQRQAERLREQEEELRSTNEELQSQQEELRQTNEELTAQTEELEIQREALERNNAELDDARKNLERKAAELTSVSAYKSQFLANMSHELRTPLNSMLLLSNLLAENDENTLNPKQVEFAKTIHTAGRDLLALINQVLDLAKIEAGKHDVRIGPVPLRRITQHVQRIFEPLALDKGLGFSVEVAPDLPDAISTDGQRLEQILNNLMGNAIKFTKKGQVGLRVGPADLDARFGRPDLRPERTLAFAVTDTGLGIAVENQDRIFAPFEQVDGAIDRRYGGTGLGLSISRELSGLLGGELQLRTELGVGSTFTCYLPREGPAVTESSASGLDTTPRAPSAAQGTRARPGDRGPRANGTPLLLLVEDDRTFAETLSEIIIEQGLDCVIAPDGGAALRLARERRPTGIILDVRLPDIDGWEVLAQLRADPATDRIPVHVVSAVDATERGAALGVIGHVQKPASRGDLLRVIDSLTRTTDQAAKRVLVVEDDVATGDSVASQLGGDKFEVLRAMTAADALDILARERIRCIVLDLGLPDMDGLQLLRKLHERDGIEMPPVVVYTARTLNAEETRTLETYAASVVLKEGASTDRLLDEVRLFTRHLKETSASRRSGIESAPAGHINLVGRRILVADDDMRTVYALSAVLRAKGAEVTLADNGQAALDALAQARTIDVVLMDIMMPVMDGYEAIRQIRRIARFREVPIVALTAKAMKDDPDKCIQAGATEYLPKPVDSERLLAMLDTFFKKGLPDGG